MAESTVRALERQLEALQKIYAAQMAGGFPRVCLTYGSETFDEAMASRGIDYEAMLELGIGIQHISLPWLTDRALGRDESLPAIGSELKAGISPDGEGE